MQICNESGALSVSFRSNDKQSKTLSFNKSYKLPDNEKWREGELTTGLKTAEFRLFKQRVETYLKSGPDGMAAALAYAVKQTEPIEIGEKTANDGVQASNNH